MKPEQNCIDYAAFWKRAAKKWRKVFHTCWEITQDMTKQTTELKEKIRVLENELQDTKFMLDTAMK